MCGEEGEEGEEAGRSTHEPWALLCPAVLSAEMRANGEVAPAPSLLPGAVVRARPAVVLLVPDQNPLSRPLIIPVLQMRAEVW